jgi:hypothetical protein
MLKMLKIKGLRSKFGLKREEVTGGWRKLHNAELHNLYSPSEFYKDDQIKVGGNCNGDEKYIQNFSQEIWKEVVTWVTYA